MTKSQSPNPQSPIPNPTQPLIIGHWDLGFEHGDKARYVNRMFTAISPRYDLMNWLMTFGQDQVWRRRAVVEVAPSAGGIILDVGTGTGDFLPLLADAAPGVRAIGVDFTYAMMAAGREKLNGYGDRITLVAGDALRLPFPDDTFDGLVNGFLLRNVADLQQTLVEMRRVIKPGRRVVCLEITNPSWPLFRDVFRLYFHRLVPLLGGIISGRPDAYTYLPQSVTRFLAPDELAQLMREVGLGQVGYRLLAWGTMAIHVGTK